MTKDSTAINGTASPALVNGAYAKCGQMSKKVSNVNNVSHRAQNGDCKSRQRPGQVRPHSQERREPNLFTASTSSVTPTSHQRRWSADFSKCGPTSVIVVKKNKKEPQPPQRGVSLLRPHSASDSSFKRYSCPPMGIFSSPSQSSSSSSSACSSCSSPPPVQTSVITGHDPLGWKLQPKSSFMSPRARTKRLSLQIPLPIIFPDPSGPAPTSKSDDPPNQDPSSKTKPPLRPKPSRRHHSDSSAFRRSLPNPLPVVTLEDLCAVHLRSVTHSYESDDVFNEGNEEEVKVTTKPRKIPPPVPEKTSMARQIAQLITLSWQRYTPVPTKTTEENIYTCVMKPRPKHSHQTVDQSSLCATKTGKEGLHGVSQY
ncbi:NHS-like protein 2 isoform X2 [Trachinotus anak]|uniref:NHS-like protein 2 isoform X2 n=1 Tax=Trachinotus anak TaxID=443729 RepID=UPI0039F1EA7D